MIRTITKTEFVDSFRKWDTYKDNFSYEGLQSLFDYLEELEEGTDTQIEFDVVGICVDFSEYANLQEIQKLYDGTNIEINNIDDLKDHTQVIEIPNTTRLIIQDF